jgi:hypothetical protein
VLGRVNRDALNFHPGGPLVGWFTDPIMARSMPLGAVHANNFGRRSPPKAGQNCTPIHTAAGVLRWARHCESHLATCLYP